MSPFASFFEKTSAVVKPRLVNAAVFLVILHTLAACVCADFVALSEDDFPWTFESDTARFEWLTLSPTVNVFAKTGNPPRVFQDQYVIFWFDSYIEADGPWKDATYLGEYVIPRESSLWQAEHNADTLELRFTYSQGGGAPAFFFTYQWIEEASRVTVSHPVSPFSYSFNVTNSTLKFGTGFTDWQFHPNSTHAHLIIISEIAGLDLATDDPQFLDLVNETERVVIGFETKQLLATLGLLKFGYMNDEKVTIDGITFPLVSNGNLGFELYNNARLPQQGMRVDQFVYDPDVSVLFTGEDPSLGSSSSSSPSGSKGNDAGAERAGIIGGSVAGGVAVVALLVAGCAVAWCICCAVCLSLVAGAIAMRKGEDILYNIGTRSAIQLSEDHDEGGLQVNYGSSGSEKIHEKGEEGEGEHDRASRSPGSTSSYSYSSSGDASSSVSTYEPSSSFSSYTTGSDE